jgi:predicted Zn-dependent peptidase
MLAARRVCNVQRVVARSFATAVESSGVKVAAVDNNGPTSSLTVLVKAGSRYEPKAGLANALKNYAFKVRCQVFGGRIGKANGLFSVHRALLSARLWELSGRASSTAVF